MTLLHGLTLLLIGLIALGLLMLEHIDPSTIDPIDIIFLLWSSLCIFASLLQLIAGWRLRHLQAPALAKASWILGLVSVVTCMMAPLSIGLMVWGWRTLNDPKVKNAMAHPELHTLPLPL